MTQQTLTFDPVKSSKAKEQGMATAADNRNQLLVMAQTMALVLWYGRLKPISIDDVFERLSFHGEHPELLGNAAGSVFKVKGWRCVGFTNSTRVSNHSRTVRLWVRK